MKFAQFSAPIADTAFISPAVFFWPTRNLMLRTMKFWEPPKLTLLCVITMPSPGAVCPARVQSARLIFNSSESTISPLTSKTMVIGSPWYCENAQRSEPSPLLLRFVTFTTFPPRPPVVYLPKPSAVGKARIRSASDGFTAFDTTPWLDTVAMV